MCIVSITYHIDKVRIEYLWYRDTDRIVLTFYLDRGLECLRVFFKRGEQNVTKQTLFERSFSFASDNAIPADNNSLLRQK